MFEKLSYTVGTTIMENVPLYALEFLMNACLVFAIVSGTILAVQWLVECILEDYHNERLLEDIKRDYFEELDEKYTDGSETGV